MLAPVSHVDSLLASLLGSTSQQMDKTITAGRLCFEKCGGDNRLSPEEWEECTI